MPDGKISVEGRLQIPWPMLVEGERYRYRLCCAILQIGVRRLIAGSTAWRPSFCAWDRFVETITMRRGLAPVSRVYLGCDSGPRRNWLCFEICGRNAISDAENRICGLTLFLGPLSKTHSGTSAVFQDELDSGRFQGVLQLIHR